jgi:hypothetical protein
MSFVEGPERYHLTFDAEGYRVVSDTPVRGLCGLASRPVPKLYVVVADERPVYVGITRQRLGARFRLGWKADGANGYHGYAFRHALTEAFVDVWYLADPPADRASADREIETLEAEVVFFIRQQGQWPAYQTEIHFHPSDERHRKTAQSIMRRYRRVAV